MKEVLSGFSRAMYSNWLWHKPLQIIVDAGEGLQLAIGSGLYRPTHLLLTHGHADHILGLPGFVAARRFSKGAPDKPLTILFPEGSPAIEFMKSMLDRLWPGAGFPLEWVSVRQGSEHPLAKDRFIRVFETSHVSAEHTVGYLVLERRQRLQPAFAALGEAELRRRATERGRGELMEPYEHILFAHTGDTMPLPPDLFRTADLLVHDATFVEAADRHADIHATTMEAIAVGRDANVKRLVLHHVSIRYDRGDLIARLRRQVQAVGYRGECWLLDEGNLALLAER